ncbi:MAG TPA: hypothetical protein VGG65_06130 [Thermoanaerobaculia bacterium]
MLRSRSALARGLSAVWLAATAASAFAQSLDPSLYGELRWRLVGPFRGGWATCAEGVPDDPAVYYFGAAAGGVWKTEDAGGTWAPVFDHAGSASVGAIAVAPSNPKVLYAGTGQIQTRYDIASGDGVYRSDDAGKTWTHVGLAATRAIGRIVVDPRDANVAIVAALGHIFGPSAERGIFRTEDGGKTWSHVLFVDENTGGADLAVDPDNSSVVYASLWQARNFPWLSYFRPDVGPGSAIYKSVDGGRTWKRLSGGGWPTTEVGRAGLAAAAGGRVYALVDAPSGRTSAVASVAGLYRSDDGGATWARVNQTPGLASSYMNRVTVDPRDRDVVYVTGQSLRRSNDGGKTLSFFKGAPGGDDYHFLWINPKNPRLMVTAADQGTVVSSNGGESWSGWYNQPTGQFYHVETDDRFPYWIYSGQQDSGTAGAATRSDYGALTYRDWHPVGGEERGWDVPDPEDPLVVYGTGLGGTITRYDSRTGQVRNVSPFVESTYGRRPKPDSIRWAWCFPLAISKTPPHDMYTGAQFLLRSRDRGQSWEKASPDLTGADPAAKGCDGEVTAAIARPCGFGVIFTIEISPRDAKEIWVGTDDGLVQLTRDAGATWKDVTPKGLPLWAKVAAVDASPLEAGAAYVAVDAHRLDDFTPRVYRTKDYGASWIEITAGLPRDRFTTVVRADTVRQGLLYAGTDAGVFVSFDDGAVWQPLQLNLPTAWVGDLAVHGTDLVAGTQGRGLWVLDDLTPLRQLDRAAASSPAHLFSPATAIRVRANENRDTPLPPDVPIARNPPAGAVIDYLVGPAGGGPITIEIIDAKGQVVRTYRSGKSAGEPGARRYFTERWINPPTPLSAAPGHHRLVWDLRDERPEAADYEYMIAAVDGEDTPIEPRGPMVAPGLYTVRLTAAGQRSEQPLDVAPDPRTSIAAGVLTEKLAVEQRIVAAMKTSFEALEDVRAYRKTHKTAKPPAAGSREARAEALEAELARTNRTLATLLNHLDAADAPATAVQAKTLRETLDALDGELTRRKQVRQGG